MLRPPHYLNIPWHIQWHRNMQTCRRQRHVWRLVVTLLLIALLMIGVRVVGGA